MSFSTGWNSSLDSLYLDKGGLRSAALCQLRLATATSATILARVRNSAMTTAHVLADLGRLYTCSEAIRARYEIDEVSEDNIAVSAQGSSSQRRAALPRRQRQCDEHRSADWAVRLTPSGYTLIIMLEVQLGITMPVSECLLLESDCLRTSYREYLS